MVEHQDDPDQQDTPDFSSEDFYSDVASVLEEALERQPKRQDLRYKLLEVYAAQGRREPFVAAALEYREELQSGGYGDWERVLALGRALFVDQQQIDRPTDEATGERHKRLGERPGDEPINDALKGLSERYAELHRDAEFFADFDRRLSLITAHPSPPLYHAARLSRGNGGARVYLAREEAHDVLTYKLANALGQGLVATRLGRKRLVTGTTSGRHGIATAMAAAHLGLKCTVYMRAEEERSQGARSRLIRRLGAELKTLPSRRTPFLRTKSQYADVLNAVRDAALKDWLENLKTTQFVNGLAAGPDPFPNMRRDFHAGTGRAVRQQLVAEHKKLPAVVVTVLDGSLDPLNFFHPFLAYQGVRLVGVESESIEAGSRKRRSDSLQDTREMMFSDNQMAAADVILHAQGFPSTRREHSWLRETRRVDYLESTQSEADEALTVMARTEGLLLSDASGHGLSQVLQLAAEMPRDESVVALIEHIDETHPTSLT